MNSSMIDRAKAARATIREARMEDVPELVRIEDLSFETDRLKVPSFRNLVKNDTATVLVAEGEAGALLGYAITLFRRSTAVARLYSIAVDKRMRGRGISRKLLVGLEDDARERGSLFLRLEVRPDNAAAIRLYQSLGYQPFGRHFGYYEDNTDALRFEKSLLEHADTTIRKVPYYPQTTDFTCGPAAMMMAMAALGSNAKLTRELELRLWREATTIVMTQGVGGCDPVGMAVALGKRGFRTAVHMTQSEPLFLDTVRSQWKREVMSIAQEDFRNEAREMRIPMRLGALSTSRLKASLSQGGIAVVLISPYRLYHERVPHWILVYDYNERHMFVHDPWLDPEESEGPMGKAGIAIPVKEFERITVYGKSRLRAAVVVEAPRTRGATQPERR